MKTFKKLFVLIMLLSALFSLNVFAMEYKNYEYVPPMPSTETKQEDETLEYRWTWLSNETCIRFRSGQKKADLERQYNTGTLETWRNKSEGTWGKKSRDTYSGKWSQSADGIKSFVFDDCTIPVGVTKIDGVLYAFNSYGELKEGYEYYNGLKTTADGFVNDSSAEFTQWLATQYLPECTSNTSK